MGYPYGIYTIGANCNVIMNGQGFYIKEGGYTRSKKRIHTRRITKTGAMTYTDLGPLWNEFEFTLSIYSGELFNTQATPTELRNAVWEMYQGVNSPITLVTPTNETFSCLFNDLKEKMPSFAVYNIDGTINNQGLQYELDVQLYEV